MEVSFDYIRHINKSLYIQSQNEFMISMEEIIKQIQTLLHLKIPVKLIIKYGSYFALPVMCCLLFAAQKSFKKRNRKIFILLTVVIFFNAVFVYAHLIERNILITPQTKIKTGFTLKAAVIADIHLGLYKDERFFSRVVYKINRIDNLDCVLIPGDFTYYPGKRINTLFNPLKDLKVPVYAVLGNHDYGVPGPDLQDPLKEILRQLGVIVLENTTAKIPNTDVTVLGIGDEWYGNDNIELVNNLPTNSKYIILAHNPETALKYKKGNKYITISGHTHGGQIRIPFIYKIILPQLKSFNSGLYETDHGPVFVTPGVGEVGLPLRLLNPPSIDILIFN